MFNPYNDISYCIVTTYGYQMIPTVSTGTQSAGHLFLGGTDPESGFFEKGALPVAKQPKYKFKSAPYTSLGDLATVSFFEQMN